MLPDGLRATTSICPICYKEVSAVTSGLQLFGGCEEHGNFTGIVEVDPRFVAEVWYNRFTDPFDALMVSITDECNTKCRFCYYPCKSGHSSSDTIRGVCAKYPQKRIWFSGGEPTAHPDILDLVTIPNFSVAITNGLLFSSQYFLKNYIDASGLDDTGCAKIAFSLHSKVPNYKIQALLNLRAMKQRIFCAMFSVASIEELPEILYMWRDYYDVIMNIRIRCPFNSWEQKSDKVLYNSQVYNAIKAMIPVRFTDDFGGNSIYSATLKFEDRYITLCCAPHYTAFDIDAVQHSPKMLALDGNIYPIPYGLIKNERYSHAHL